VVVVLPAVHAEHLVEAVLDGPAVDAGGRQGAVADGRQVSVVSSVAGGRSRTVRADDPPPARRRCGGIT
jgi:hypothetical protein